LPRRRPRRDDRRGLARRGPVRDPLPLILVVCEGTVTEPEYLDGFRRAERANTVRVHIKTPGGDPLALVEHAAGVAAEARERARREEDDNQCYDEVWCVFDVDEHARLDEARRRARECGILLAVSNPCFELWLLLHFVDHTAHAERKRLAALLQQHLPGYGKHVDFQALSSGYAAAAARGAALDQRHARAGTEDANPSTGVYRLTTRIRELGMKGRM